MSKKEVQGLLELKPFLSNTSLTSALRNFKICNLMCASLRD